MVLAWAPTPTLAAETRGVRPGLEGQLLAWMRVGRQPGHREVCTPTIALETDTSDVFPQEDGSIAGFCLCDWCLMVVQKLVVGERMRIEPRGPIMQHTMHATMEPHSCSMVTA